MFVSEKIKGWFTLPTPLIMALACCPAHAYLGPGGAVSSIGALLALIGAVLLAIIGFVWFPIKRMLARKQRSNEDDNDNDNEDNNDNEVDSGSLQKPEKP